MPCVDFEKVAALLRPMLPRGHASPQHSHKNRVGRHEYIPSDATQPRRTRANISQREHDWQETVFVVGTGRYVVALVSINKSSDGSHARLHNPSCCLCPKKQQ